LDYGNGNEFFYNTRQDNLKEEVISCLEFNHKPPDELREYLYRKEFGYTHLEYDKIPSKRLENDLLIMSLINEWQGKSK
jgi:hypothetical protein